MGFISEALRVLSHREKTLTSVISGDPESFAISVEGRMEAEISGEGGGWSDKRQALVKLSFQSGPYHSPALRPWPGAVPSWSLIFSHL